MNARWIVHNVIAHPLLILCPPVGRWLHDRTAPQWVEVRCHLCGKLKRALDEDRALYLLAFHYDRRHHGWTHATVASSSETRSAI